MRIVIATPLYPPDTAPAASYVKELALRLSTSHEVRVLAYGHLPERVRGVSIQTIEKKLPLFVRILAFSYALFLASFRADRLYIVNGASTELPASLISLFTLRTFVACIADPDAAAHSRNNSILKFVHRAYIWRSEKVIQEEPPLKPEILPFSPHPTVAIDSYEAAWHEHLKSFES